jgi:hypothetical protein
MHFTGRPLQALDLLLQKPGDPLSLQRGTQHLLEQLWRCLSFGVHFAANEKDPATQQLLETSRQLLALTERLDPADLGEREANEASLVLYSLVTPLTFLRLPCSRPSGTKTTRIF